MRFTLLDRILEINPHERLRAIKAVSSSEEYLADHFPTFPVLPGVLMLEALAEAGAWLVRASLGFQHNLILLREAKNITYKSFVRPGGLLEVTVQARRIEPSDSDFTGVGMCEGREVVKGRFSLRHLSVRERSPNSGAADAALTEQMQRRFSLLCSDSRPQADSHSGRERSASRE